MRNESALDALMTNALDRVGAAEIVVGIPSYRNAGTIGYVVRAVVDGLDRSFPDTRSVLVNADGGSDDGTPDAVRSAVGDHPAIVGAYVGPPGKGSAFRAIFESAARLGARACAVVDSDLRSITPQWIDRLIRPVVAGEADYVAPLYARHKHDGTITNTIAYPLTRALYGARIRQPIGGEFGFSGDLARAFLEGAALASSGETIGLAVWGSDVARFGIDVYMTTTALVRGARCAQAALGAKVHDPKDPGADLAPMFRQVVGTAFRLAAVNAQRWTAVTGSREVPVVGDMPPAEVEPIPVDARALARRFGEGAAKYRAMWDEALSAPSADAARAALEEEIPHALTGAWARIVYDLLVACARRPSLTESYVLSCVPLYYGRVAALVDDARDLDTREAERLVEEQAAAFEAAKPYLRERWPW